MAKHVLIVEGEQADRRLLENLLRENGFAIVAMENAKETDIETEANQFRLLVDNSYDLIWTLDGQGNFTYVSPSWKRTLGYNQDEIIGKSFESIIHPDDVGSCVEYFLKAINGEKYPSAWEYRVRHADGTWQWHTASGAPALAPDGSLISVIGISRDITDRKRAEQALKESEEKYRIIIEQMEDGYFEVDLKGQFTFLNDAQTKLLGYSRDELIGMNNRQYQDEKNARKIFECFHEIYETGKPAKLMNYEVIRKDKEIRMHEITASLMTDAEGQPAGFRGIARDVTEHWRAEQKRLSLEDRLQHARRMEAIGQLAGGVAHVLNNILGILIGYSELLLAEIPEGQRARNHVEKILRSTQRGTLIVQDLLTLARRERPSSELINLNDIIADFLKTTSLRKIREAHPQVTLKTDCAENLLSVKGSPAHLEKALANLVSNAAEAIAEEGWVTIRTENRRMENSVEGYDDFQPGNYVILSVTDTGTGIPEEQREKIFEPFYTKKTMGKNGTGLGLSIVWATVKDLNGHIDVQTRVGEGTTFTIYFPVVLSDEPVV